MDIETEQGNYLVPLHEFTKHALLGEYAHYNPQSSLVACNVFDVSMADPREHFLSSLIISFISSNLGNRDNDGFVSGDTIVSEMSRLSFIDEQVFAALRRLASRRMIETPHAHYREITVEENEAPNKFHYRATSIGLYHVKFWIGSFSFLDAMSIDTPIFEENARHAVNKHSDSFEISHRFKRTSTFKDYLESRWHLANFDVTYFNFPAVVAAHKDEFTAVDRASRAAPGNQKARRAQFGRGKFGMQRNP